MKAQDFDVLDKALVKAGSRLKVIYNGDENRSYSHSLADYNIQVGDIVIARDEPYGYQPRWVEVNFSNGVAMDVFYLDDFELIQE
jgi:hypothetical protein